MGRKKKYFTNDELEEANRQKAMRFYERHKEQRKKEARERYWKKKLEKENDNIQND